LFSFNYFACSQADIQGPAVDDFSATNPLIFAGAAPHTHTLVQQCDLLDSDKPHMVTEYVDDLYQYYKDLEVRVSRLPSTSLPLCAHYILKDTPPLSLI
jgi:hypothetical protein